MTGSMHALIRLVALTTLAAAALACEPRPIPDAIPPDWPFPLDAEPGRATHGMVVSTDAYASEVGRDV
ncbi:MAG: hypothetical protein VKI81_09560, partial [Synechococcaceae cyanobacterium]|nr:hypothetical protein [Synechococcaceae cyanobacterium]